MRIYIYEYNACLLIENELFPLIRLLKWKDTRFRLLVVNDAQKLDTVPIYSMGTVWSCIKSRKCNVIEVYGMRTLAHKESKNILKFEWIYMNADLRYILKIVFLTLYYIGTSLEYKR